MQYRIIMEFDQLYFPNDLRGMFAKSEAKIVIVYIYFAIRKITHYQRINMSAVKGSYQSHFSCFVSDKTADRLTNVLHQLKRVLLLNKILG